MRLDLEWTRRVGNAERIILDEAQAWPEILARVRGAVDADRKRNGRFLLLGSVAPSLATHASESLAGRLSQIELAPLQWSEVPSTSRKHLWLRGGYPDGGILDVGTRLNHAFPQWQVDYLALLAQRDFPSWGLPAKPQVTDRLLRLVAEPGGYDTTRQNGRHDRGVPALSRLADPAVEWRRTSGVVQPDGSDGATRARVSVVGSPLAFVGNSTSGASLLIFTSTGSQAPKAIDVLPRLRHSM